MGLDIGDGKVSAPHDTNDENTEDYICIPEEFCNLQVPNSVEEMIDSTFPNFLENYKNADYLSERAILTPTNKQLVRLILI